MKLNRFVMLLFLVTIQVLFGSIALSQEPEVIFIDVENYSPRNLGDIQLACDVLGVKLKTLLLSATQKTDLTKSGIRLTGEKVLILTARVLEYSNVSIISQLWQSGVKTKVLIIDINSNTDIRHLKTWSRDRIKNLTHCDLKNSAKSIKVIHNDEVSMELGGLEYPLNISNSGIIHGLELEESLGAMRLIEVIDGIGKPVCTLFSKADSEAGSVFFLTSLEKLFPTEAAGLYKIMPILMFLKYCFKDRCWHGSNDYANLTIDDPWLREPYGYLSFADLCREAKKNRFHVTIGFIPYNYQKSHNDAIEIFQQCQQNLSMAVHGNNHDLSEFRPGGNTNKKLNDISPDEKNILQALYRMDAFKQKTGLLYDRVMIFPRSVFTKESLGMLKKHNFLMTVNWGVPLSAGYPQNPVDRMREISLEFKNFPMLQRFAIPDWKKDKRAAAVAKSWIQMRLFLDLPVLLYTHHDFFKDGADAFNSIAETINKVQPEVVWSGLGAIAKKLYLQKRIDEREIEILSFSSDINVVNNYHVPMKFVFRKQEDFLIPVESVEVDGVKHEYHQDGNHIRVEVLIGPGCEKNIRILYYSNYQVGSFTYSDNDLQATLVRSLSDFRDLYLSKLPFGDKMVKTFYWVGGVKNIVIYLLGLAGLILVLLVCYIKNEKSKKRNSMKV